MKSCIVIAIVISLLISVNIAICQEITPVLKNDAFVMATFKTADDYLGKWWRLAYTEIFKRLNMKVEFRDYPKKRVSIEADAGRVDGEPGRIFAYANEYPNLIRVGESLCAVNFSAFTAQDSIPPLNGWDSLKGTDYKVEYQWGTVTCENKLPRVVKKENLSVVTEQVHALKKLIPGRIDLFVNEESGVLTLLKTPEFKESNIRIAGVMESVPLYPYLHKKHAALAPKMDEIIKAMKAEGLIEQYRMTVEKELGIVRK